MNGVRCPAKLFCCAPVTAALSPPAGVATLSPSVLSRPMQRKLVTLVNCQLVEEEGRVRAVRAGRSLGERTVTELILQHQNPQQLSANLWAAVRARGCQFLGPGGCGSHDAQHWTVSRPLASFRHIMCYYCGGLNKNLEYFLLSVSNLVHNQTVVLWSSLLLYFKVED